LIGVGQWPAGAGLDTPGLDADAPITPRQGELDFNLHPLFPAVETRYKWQNIGGKFQVS